MKNWSKVIGVMSGTSMDGIDVGLVYIERETLNTRLVSFATLKFPSSIRREISEIILKNRCDVEKLAEINFKTGEVFADKINRFLKSNGIRKEQIAIISSHGQTIFHKPKITMQIGEPSVIAIKTGITTVADFRPSDIAQGGEGAPLAPVFHNLLFRNNKENRVVINIGGISNITYLDKNGEGTIGYDTGPGNWIIDNLMKLISKGKSNFDRNGNIARKGNVNYHLVEEYLKKDNFFQIPPPKSTGIDRICEPFFKKIKEMWGKNILNSDDTIATATFLTIQSIQKGLEFLKDKDYKDIILCGGGANNSYIISNIKELNKNKNILTSDKLGIHPKAVEVAGFGLLGYLCITGRKNSLYGSIPVGKICPGKNFKEVKIG